MFLQPFGALIVIPCSPRVCGDVSETRETFVDHRRFSPRMRGCFSRDHEYHRQNFVLPAYAGMFPVKSEIARLSLSSPRVCGDVSSAVGAAHLAKWFSPRMRGCFPQVKNNLRVTVVLPAYAGMFLSGSVSGLTASSSPRVCGDVSGAEIQTQSVP